MKINRMLSIIMLLLTRDVITAPEFAHIFNVALRTIYRDIEEIKSAGIQINAETGLYGGIRIPKEFKKEKNITPSSDIVSVLLMLIDQYPKLLENKNYIIAKYRSDSSMRNKIGEEENNMTVIRVTIRFHESYKDGIEKQYDLIITSLKNGYYEADIYIEADEGEYDSLLLLCDKCECIAPAHVRGYIENKISAIYKMCKQL